MSDRGRLHLTDLRAVSRGPRATRPGRRWRLPRRTVRLRLTLLYGALFFVSGFVLLALVLGGAVGLHAQAHAVEAHPGTLGLPGVRSFRVTPSVPAVSIIENSQRTEDLRVLAFVAAIALLIMGAVSIVLGWLMAGRILRPLGTITATVRDISATNLHRRLSLGGPEDEFKELADTFDGLLGRLDGAFQSQRQFVANASHELRTPLARLKTLAQVALADPHASAASLREAHLRVLASEQQLEELIESLLNLASSERGLERFESVDLAAITEQVLAGRRAEIERRELQVHATLEPALVEGNPQLVERLVANLIDNAVRHNTVGGQVDVKTIRDARRVVLSVANDGPIVPESELERLSRPFQRLGTERTTQGEGHGLGLSIVHAIAGAHGATVSTRARPYGGLEIEVGFALLGSRLSGSGES
jgi:signal transduction histidine kinase